MAEVKTEFEDAQEEIDEKIRKLAKLVKKSKRVVVFTGAGISTAAGIPDFRGDNGLDANPVPLVTIASKEKALDWTWPTLGHVGVAQLVKSGRVGFVCTSNHDGIHDRAGTPLESLADLFGNAYVEQCSRCKTQYRRSVIVPNIGRKCEKPECARRLHKTGTRMGGQTPQEPLDRAHKAAKKADLALVLGSSLTVRPFCDLPFLAKKVVICTLQRTSYDNHKRTAMTIHAKCDEVVGKVLSHLGLHLEPLTIRYPLSLTQTFDGISCTISIKSGANHEPITVIESASVSRRHEASGKTLEYDLSEPSSLSREEGFSATFRASAGSSVDLIIRYKDELGVEPTHIEVDVQAGSQTKRIDVEKTIEYELPAIE